MSEIRLKSLRGAKEAKNLGGLQLEKLELKSQGYWVHNLDPFLVDTENVQVPIYWAVYLVAYFFVFYFCSIEFKKSKYPEKLWDIYSSALPLGWLGMILGSRLFYAIFYYPEYFSQNPSHLYQIWRGGMSFHGAIIGGYLAILWICHIKKQPVLPLLEKVCILVPFGLLLGRLANFVNGELVGTPTLLPWAVVFPRYDSVPRHPSQIYEAIGEGAVLGILMLIAAKRWILGNGKLLRFFLLSYGSIRLFIEQFREPDVQIGKWLFGLNFGQFLCILMITLACVPINRARGVKCRKEKAKTMAFKIDS